VLHHAGTLTDRVTFAVLQWRRPRGRRPPASAGP
jgi:hypothetical protein